MPPLTPPEATAADVIDTVPDPELVDEPARMTISLPTPTPNALPPEMNTVPPVSVVLAVLPATRTIEPTTPERPGPTATLIDPATPLVAGPDCTNNHPLFPTFVVPLLKTTAPDSPFTPTFAECNATNPLPELELAPLRIDTIPPTPRPLDEPALRTRAPPPPASKELLPATIDTEPPTPESPVPTTTLIAPP
jgi:hypothetical protein